MIRSWLVLAVVLGATLAVAGCDTGAKRSVTQVAAPEDVLDEALMVALAQAKNFHHKADVHLSDGNRELAIADVRQILSIPFPPGTPEAEDVLLDARARLGKLLLSNGDFDDAMRVVEEGIAASSRESYFLANVHTVRGEIFEERAKVAADETEAKRLRRRAIEAFDSSIRINEKVQKRLMKEMGL